VVVGVVTADVVTGGGVEVVVTDVDVVMIEVVSPVVAASLSQPASITTGSAAIIRIM
jgi:hypothetical protein